MPVQINYKNSTPKQISSNLVLFVDEKFNISGLNKYISNSEFSYIRDLLQNSDLKKDLLVFEINSKKTIFLVSVKKDIKTSEVENLGGKFHGYINFDKKKEYFVNSDTINSKIKNFVGYFLHGLKLKSYEFNVYKSKKNKKFVSINVIGNKNKISSYDQLKFKALEEGTFFARDLVSEPGNILHPDEYAKRINSLKKFGLKINIYNEKKLKKLGMNALLGVGQGSIRGSYLVTMEWNGAKNNSKPLAFVGKGVCFDTGGISLKPAKFMEDMTYDMAGSATVVGLMKNLALRKAKINAVGVVGLVENMPGGNAQRPGDIVKSYSGKTIEILNTDAEGRLVLADALTFTEKNFKPRFMVDLATLTGAIIVSLGSEYAWSFF
jgi:leucyl aminopeptidase